MKHTLPQQGQRSEEQAVRASVTISYIHGLSLSIRRMLDLNVDSNVSSSCNGAKEGFYGSKKALYHSKTAYRENTSMLRALPSRFRFFQLLFYYLYCSVYGSWYAHSFTWFSHICFPCRDLPILFSPIFIMPPPWSLFAFPSLLRHWCAGNHTALQYPENMPVRPLHRCHLAGSARRCFHHHVQPDHRKHTSKMIYVRQQHTLNDTLNDTEWKSIIWATMHTLLCFSCCSWCSITEVLHVFFASVPCVHAADWCHCFLLHLSRPTRDNHEERILSQHHGMQHPTDTSAWATKICQVLRRAILALLSLSACIQMCSSAYNWVMRQPMECIPDH